jgi:predicted NBD/HSP70 family sugar kinase
LSAVTAAHVFAAARDGDGVAVSVVRDTARYVGTAVASMVAMMDPEVVVLGGGLIASGLVTAELGADAAAIGAARATMLG